MFFSVTPYLVGKFDGMARRKPSCPYEAASKAAEDYAAGYVRGLKVA